MIFIATTIFTEFFKTLEFFKLSETFKSADITLAYKNVIPNKPVKNLEKRHLLQISTNFGKIFSKWQTGFWQAFRTESYLVIISWKFSEPLDNCREYTVLYADH